MRLTSPAFEDGQEMDQKYGKKIQNISVPLVWEDIPEGTRSFALVIVDRHPVAQNYIHWMVSDINSQITSLDENAAAGHMPTGSKELWPYAGPFPPSGTHDYECTLYALSVETLGLPAQVDLDTFTAVAESNALAAATLTGKFTKISD